MNFLNETIKSLTENDKTINDVQWVFCGNYLGKWSDFEKLADFEYDEGFGSQNINSGVKIVGLDWWLERGEYDGSEWWEFKSLPLIPNYSNPLTKDCLLDSYYIGKI